MNSSLILLCTFFCSPWVTLHLYTGKPFCPRRKKTLACYWRFRKLGASQVLIHFSPSSQQHQIDRQLKAQLQGSPPRTTNQRWGGFHWCWGNSWKVGIFIIFCSLNALSSRFPSSRLPSDRHMRGEKQLPEAQHHLVQEQNSAPGFQRRWDDASGSVPPRSVWVRCLFLLPSPSCFLLKRVFSSHHPKVSISHRTTSESSGLYSVTSELSMRVTKEVKNDFFYCEVTYFVPGETRMMDSPLINVTVLCEFRSPCLHSPLLSECRKRLKLFFFNCETSRCASVEIGTRWRFRWWLFALFPVPVLLCLSRWQHATVDMIHPNW